MVDLLGAVVEASCVAKANGVGCRENTEIRVWGDHLVLVQQGQLAVHFQHALDHKHNVSTASVILIKHDGGRVAESPGQDSFLEICHLFSIFEFDGVFTDQVNPADVAVEIYANRRPV